MGTCVNCGGSPTIRAHLFPKAFCRRIGVDLNGRPEDFAHIYAGSDRFRPVKTGLFDEQILCADCDQILGRLDGEAFSWTERTKSEVIYPYRGKLPTVCRVEGNPQRLLLFALSVLWRFAISVRPEVRPLKVGPYAERLRAILFDDAPVTIKVDCLVVSVKTDIKGAENMYRTPRPIRNDYLNGFYFYLRGFEYLIRLGIEMKSVFSAQEDRGCWLRLATEINLPIMRFEHTAIGCEWIKLRNTGHPGFAYAVREKRNPNQS
jgi:hypothetical protein